MIKLAAGPAANTVKRTRFGEADSFGGALGGGEDVNVRPGVNGEAGRQAPCPPVIDRLHDRQRGRSPIEQWRTGGHHDGVHHRRVLLDDFGEFFKVAVEQGLAATMESARGIFEARRLQRAGVGKGMAARRADGLMFHADQCNAIHQRPMVEYGEGDSKRVTAIGGCPHLPFDKPGGDGAAGRAGT
jgi:hypothetical protein